MLATISATLFTAMVLAVGYWSLGLATMLLFTTGFFTGLVLFLLRPGVVPFRAVRWPFFISLALFALHRVEEYLADFFETLAAITGVPTPDVASPPVVMLVVLSVGAWLLVPFLMGRTRFGTYLAWTFFAAMGLTELAHVVLFPIIVGRPFEYFPGMASVFLLAPAGWWGLVTMWRRARL